MLIVGFATFSTYQVPDYAAPAAAAAAEIVGRLLIQIESDGEAQCMTQHTSYCLWLSCFLGLLITSLTIEKGAKGHEWNVLAATK